MNPRPLRHVYLLKNTAPPALKKLAVIILNWNGLKLLKRFIPAAARFTSGDDVDLIVADNGSTDQSLQWLKKEYPWVITLALGKNPGFAAGYNLAIEHFRQYPYTILLNSDVEVTEGWWQPLLAFMEANADAGACQPKIRSLRHPESFEYAGAAGGLLDRMGYPFCRGRLFDIVEKDSGQYDTQGPVDIAWASGAALMVRTELYLGLGGLDPAFFAHQEEIDLCCRIHGAGYRVCYVPGPPVFHLGGASLSYDNPQKTYLNFRNNLLLIHKNLPRSIGRRRTFLRRVIDTAAIAMYLLKGDAKNAGAIIRAHRDFARMARDYTSFPDRDILRSLPGSDRRILIDRYLRHIRSGSAT